MKKAGAWVLKIITSLITAILLWIIRILRAPLVMLEEWTEEKGPLFAPTTRKVRKEDFDSPQEFITFLKAKVGEIWKLRINVFLLSVWRLVLKLFKSPTDTLDDFYDNVDNPEYDPTDLRGLRVNFWKRVKSVWREKTLVGRARHQKRMRKAAMKHPAATHSANEGDQDDNHPPLTPGYRSQT